VANIRIYLAGPEVFLANAADIIAAKSDLTREAGFHPVAPGDADIPATLSKHARGLAISEYDEHLMDSSDAIIANLTPFRGPGADPGTAYELGYMSAQNKPAFAYTNDARSHFQRVMHFYGGEVTKPVPGHTRGPDGLLVEDFDMPENLMLAGGVERRTSAVVVGSAPGGQEFSDLTAFSLTLAQAAKKLL